MIHSDGSLKFNIISRNEITLSKIRNAAYLSTLSLYGYQLINLVFTMFIARVFSPDDLGVYAIAVAVTLISGEVRLLGAGEFLIRKKNVTVEQIKSSLGLSIILSWGLGFSLLLGARFIGLFYENTDVEYLIYFLTVGFFTAPFISINNALLTKDFIFRKTLLITWGGFVVNITSAITLYFLEFGYFSLAYGSALGLIAQLGLSMCYQSDKMQWFPHFFNVSEQLKFGGIASSCNLLDKFRIMSFDVILGKIGEARDVAIMSRGIGAVEFVSHMLVAGANPVALPYLSQSSQKDLVYSYFKATLLITAICLPVLMAMTAIGPELVFVLFGEQWTESGALVGYIALWSALRLVHPFTRALLFSIKLEKQYLYLQLTSVIMTVIAIVVGFNEGLLGIAKLLVLAAIVDFLLMSKVISMSLKISLLNLANRLKSSIGLALVCGLFAWLVKLIISDYQLNAYMTVIYFGLVMTICWIVTVKTIRHPIIEELNKLPMLGQIAKKIF